MNAEIVLGVIALLLTALEMWLSHGHKLNQKDKDEEQEDSQEDNEK